MAFQANKASSQTANLWRKTIFHQSALLLCFGLSACSANAAGGNTEQKQSDTPAQQVQFRSKFVHAMSELSQQPERGTRAYDEQREKYDEIMNDLQKQILVNDWTCEVNDEKIKENGGIILDNPHWDSGHDFVFDCYDEAKYFSGWFRIKSNIDVYVPIRLSQTPTICSMPPMIGMGESHHGGDGHFSARRSGISWFAA